MKKTAVGLFVVVLVVSAACGDEAGEATALAVSTTTQTPVAAEEDLLDVVITRGELGCGVNEILPGFGYKDSEGVFTGFDVDLCRAVAAAILGDAGAVRYQSLNSATRFEAVNSGLIDLLSRNTTWTQSRDTDLGLDFGPTIYYDGQQLMAKGSAGFTSMSTLEEIEGAVVCANAGTTTEKNIS
nr:transporter substrate-binding domain-containing protein [Acidimicrobiia bacterium]